MKNEFLLQYETLDDWKITDVSRSFIMHPSKDNDTGFLVFNTFEMSETDAIYWLAPNLYLGNKLQSYGLNIIFMITWVRLRIEKCFKGNIRYVFDEACNMFIY